MAAADIVIKGAREHNLRDVTVSLPRNKLICLTGVSGSGKSSLAFACARAGWTFVSDDATWLPIDEPAIAVGRPRHARFREDAPRLFPELARYAAEQRPNGKITIEAPLADFPLKTIASNSASVW